MEDIRQLIIQAQGGNVKALNQLCTNWYRFVYNLAFKYFADEDTAQDVSQQTFIKVQQKLGQLSDPAGFKAWLCRIVINLCHTENRQRKSRIQTKDRLLNENTMTYEMSPEEKYQRKESSKMVLKALQSLPKEQRTIIIMKEYEGLKFREIADILNISESTAKSRLYYGLKGMRKIFTAKKENRL